MKQQMAKETPATRFLTRAGAPYVLVTYAYDPEADAFGLHAAASIGVPPSKLLNSLMVKVDNRIVCALLPSDRQASMKRIAAALLGRSASMMKPADAERITGYKVGGISPFGQRGRSEVVVDSSAFEYEHVYVNGGRRGLQLLIRP